MKLQGVIFDLDGVITDTAHLHFQAWQQIAAEIGFREPFPRYLGSLAPRGQDGLLPSSLVLQISAL